MIKAIIFAKKYGAISKIKVFFALKGTFLETTYVFVITYQLEVCSIILTSFRQEGSFTSYPPENEPPKKPNLVRVKVIKSMTD